MRSKWQEVLANADAFRAAAITKGFVGNWITHAPVTLTFQLPATELQVSAVEHALGTQLPDKLRNFFLEASSGIEIRWLLPAQVYETSDGVTNVEYKLLPPAPLLETSTNGEVSRNPKSNGCILEFSLANLHREHERAKDWIAGFQEASDAADANSEEKLHYARYADFWRRGIAIASDGGGNVLAVDRESGLLLYLFHDGSDEPGWFLEMDLMDFMVAFSQLGFPGFGVTELLTFQASPSITGTAAQRHAETFGSEAQTNNLAMPSSVIISPNSPNGLVWRQWLGHKLP